MQREKLAFRIQLVAAVLGAALCFLVATSLVETVITVGDKAPDFKVTTDRGRQMSRSDFGGKVLVLNFWATWCPPCIEELPSLEVMAQQLGPKGVVVLGVSVDQNEQAYRQFLARAKVSFETSRDPKGEIGATYGTFKYPETYVIDRDGKVRQKHIGPRDWTEPSVLQSIESLL